MRSPHSIVRVRIGLGGVALAATLLLSPKEANAADDYSGWSLNFTPALIGPRDGYGWGGGVDPEVKYTIDCDGARLSAGLRVGGYYANDLFGIMAMPTLRITVPVGPVEPYAGFGMGYGWIPEEAAEDIATMSRLGVVFRVNQRLGIGLEGTLQKIENSEFRFPSLGSAVTFDF